jgi:hypothetical protein
VDDREIGPRDLRFSCVISTVTGIRVLHISNEDDAFSFPNTERGTVTVCLPHLTLFPGTYTVSLWVGSQHYDDYDYVIDFLGFEVMR